MKIDLGCVDKKIEIGDLVVYKLTSVQAICLIVRNFEWKKSDWEVCLLDIKKDEIVNMYHDLDVLNTSPHVDLLAKKDEIILQKLNK